MLQTDRLPEYKTNGTKPLIPIGILDNSIPFLRLLVYVLKQRHATEVEVIAAAASLDELLEQATADPAVILLGLSVPNLVDPAVVARLRERWPQTRIIVLSWIYLEEYRLQALAAKADAVVPKTQLDTTLLPAIRRLNNGARHS